MTNSPTLAELCARARADLRIGLPVVLDAGGGGALALAVETASPERVAAMGQGARMALTARRAEALKLAAYDGDLVRIALDGEAEWARAVADPSADLRRPLKGPFRPIREGDAAPDRAALALAKAAQLLPAALLAPLPDPRGFAAAHQLTCLPQEAAHLDPGAPPERVAAARLPMTLAEQGRLHIFRPPGGGVEHYAVEIGAPDRAAPVLCRLHSACFTGDVLGSLKCDCGPQLHGALSAMNEAGAGVLLYLNQEGRGIGLANKMRAYDLQDQGFDTVEANHRLGFEDDERDFRLGAWILREMGIGAVRLMTNNPAKIARMKETGIAVAERVPLKVGHTALNADYLAVKAAKSGHLL